MNATSARTPLRWLGGVAAGYRSGLLDRCGSVCTRGWQSTAANGTATIRSDALPGVLALHEEVFGRPGQALHRYARLFPHTFYIVEDGPAVIDFCSCYIRPTLSRAGPTLRARIFSIAVYPAYHGQGVARRMLGRCMAEMDRNGIASVDLYVDRENLPALAAYSRFGFEVVDEVPDVCGRGRCCYRLERTFLGPEAVRVRKPQEARRSPEEQQL